MKNKTAEEILKSKLDAKIAIINNPDYTFNKVIEAMEAYAKQERLKGITEGFNAAREIKSFYLIDGTIHSTKNKYPTPQDYLNSKNKP